VGYGNFVRADRPRPARGSEPSSLERAVTPHYFHLLGIPVLRGHGFTDRDSESAPRVALINENFARHFFPGENPIGKELLIPATVQIIGIVANNKEAGVNEVDFDDVYVPFAQSPASSMFAIVKTSAPSSLGLVLRRKFQHLDADQFVAEPRMLDSYVADQLRGSGAKLALILIFAGLALMLTAVALYGTLSFAVAQRTREIGVRIALGAQRTKILGLTFRNVLRLTLAGSVCGFLIAFLLGTMLRSTLYLSPHEHEGILYKVGIHDPLSFASAASVLILFAVLAGLLPALRASRIDPCETLRCE
jgi:ABC-type antimicrobial peptide transport system permease subunit